MAYVESVSVSTRVEVDPLEESTFVFYRVPGAHRFITKKATVHFPSGTGGELSISFWRGIKKVIPDWGEFVGDDVIFSDYSQEEFRSGSGILIYCRNKSMTSVHYAEISLEGELHG